MVRANTDRKKLCIPLLCAVLFFGCSDNEAQKKPDGGIIQVFFTNPDGESVIEDTLIAIIDNAEKTIFLAGYSFDLHRVSNALIRAHNRGLDVRIVCERERINSGRYPELASAGIPVIPDDDQAITHDKYIVIDTFWVWTGSANFTYTSFYDDANNAIIIGNRNSAIAYLNDFSQMYSNCFHTCKRTNGTENITLDSANIQILFTPQDQPYQAIVDFIRNSEEEILVAMFSFTHANIALELRNATARGVSVLCILDSGSAQGPYSIYPQLIAWGIPVSLDRCRGDLHHKFAVSDNKKVLTGSGNWSINGTQYNDENFVIIESEKIAQKFKEEFLKYWH